jgi:glutamyl-tRNA synthetase/glutamyl-Q tRNA(Asp) synthetase
MRTRFAPSPTGYLHIGHVVNAIYVWGMARARGGEVLLRIEDHDRQRSRPEYEAALLDDLDWLGFQPDIYSTDEFRRGRCPGRQSDRDEIYRHALAPLIDRQLVYGCDCTRRQLESPVYPGTCRERRLPLRDGVGWRVRLQTDDGDVLVRDRLGNWTYQWAVTVDDTRQEITHVIRGDDLRDSTPRQIALAQLLGREVPPEFVHHPLIMKSASQKVSKSDGDTGVRELRASGWTAGRVIGEAAAQVGLQPVSMAIHATDAGWLFTSGNSS